MPKEPPIPSRSALPAARRRTAAAVALATALLLLGASSASAADFFAAPGASNAATCLAVDPCALATAVERTRPDSGDTVFVNSGTYTDQNGSQDLGPAGLIALKPGTNLVGDSGRPRIVSHNRNAAATVEGAAGARIEFVEVSGQGATVVRLKGATAVGLVAEAPADAQIGAIACDAFNAGADPRRPPATGPLRSVACMNDAVEGIALRMGTEISAGEAQAQVRGATAISTGIGSTGIQVLARGNGIEVSVPTYRADIALAIARGTLRDVAAISLLATQDNRFNPAIKAELSSSAFVNTFTQGGVGVATITSPNANGNLNQRVVLSGFHQLPTSATVDRGRVGPEAVPPLDVDREPRPQGLAVDIGADELALPSSTEAFCFREELRAESTTSCRVVVSSLSAPAPSGTVSLESGEPTALSSPECTLTQRSPTESTCGFTYTPATTGGHSVTATYSGPTHEESEDVVDLIVIDGIETTTRVVCDPRPARVGSPTDCEVFVREAGTGRFTHGVLGTVSLQSAGDGLSNPGFFTPSICSLDGREVEASCEVTYTPNEAGGHILLATYRPFGVHLQSGGRTDLPVAPEQRPRGETATSLSCDPPIVEAQAATECRAVVVDLPAGSEVPGGAVELQSNARGTFSTTRCPLQTVEGLAECRFFYIPQDEEEARHDLFATYTGQATRRPSQASTALQVTEVRRRSLGETTTSISCAPSPLLAKQTTTCTVRVNAAGASAPPTGTVQIGSDGSARAPESCDLAVAGTGEGTCQFAYTPRRAEGGSHRIFATYLGDNLFEASSGEFTLPVLSLTLTELTCAPSSVSVGDPSTCRFVVSQINPGDEPFFQLGRADAEDEDEEPAVPTGSVGFLSAAPGAFSKGGVCELAPISTTSAACDLTYTPSDKVPGNHAIVAEYEGDAEFDGRRLTATVQARANLSTATLACTPNPAPLGTLVDCVATVVSSRADTAPTGEVQFRTDRASGGLKGKSCELEPVPGAANESRCLVGYDPGRAGSSGTHLIDVRYGGDRAHAGDDDAVALEVEGNQPDMSVVCVPSRVRNGAPTGCEVTVTDRQQPRQPVRGSVRFSSDRAGEFGNAEATCALEEREVGVSRCAIGYQPGSGQFGPHTITAEYLPDPEHDRAQATALVDLLRNTATTARCVAGPGGLPENTLELNQAATCTVTVTDPTGFGAPTDRVTFAGTALEFNDPASPSCELQPAGGNSSSCTIDLRANTAGATALLSTYLGSDVHAGSDVTTPLQVVDRARVVVRLGCTPQAMTLDEPAQCTATVEDPAANPTLPTGQVTLASDRDGGFEPADASCVLARVEDDRAACTLAYTPRETGRHLLTARYGGDAAHESREAGAVFEVTEQGGGEDPDEPGEGEDGGEDDDPRTHPTTTSLDCVPAGTGVREPTTCFVLVRDGGADPTAPGGSISFDSDRGDRFVPVACALEPVDGETSFCSASYAPTTAGLHQLVATYSGDGTHEPGEPAATALNVGATRTDTVTSVLCVPAQVVGGEETTCTAAVAGSADAPRSPTGEVEFESPASAPGVVGCELESDGRAGDRANACSVTIRTEEGEPGAREVKASYVGDANHKASSGTTAIELISADEAEKNPALTTLVCEPTEVEADSATSCVATVVDTGSPRRPLTGRIGLAVEPAGGLSVSGCETGGANGRATCAFTLTPNVGGSRLVTATFAGDAAHRASSAEAQVFAFEAPDTGRSETSTQLRCEPREVAIDAAAGCIATVTDEGDPTTPFEGRVEFRSDQLGAFSEATCAADEAAGTLTCNAAFGPRVLGLHRLEATFVGDAAHRSSSGGATVTAVDPDGDDEDEDPRTHPTRTVIECVPAGTGVSEATNCTARVTDTGTDADPTSPEGSVGFDSDRGDPFVPVACELEPVDEETSACSASYTPTVAGFHQLTATYGGDGTHEPGNPARLRLTVSALRTESTTSVLCTPAELVAGELISCTATVAGRAGGPSSSSGRVEFESTAAGVFPAGSNCELRSQPDETASACSVAFKTDEGQLGSREVKASYVGDASHKASSGTTAIELVSADQAEKNPTLATLACEPTEVEAGTATNCVATIADTGSVLRPLSGRIELSVAPAGGLSVSGCETAGAVGSATCEFTLTPDVTGSRIVTATFAGDDAHRGSSAEAEVFAFDAPDNDRSDTSTQLFCAPSEVAVDAAAGCTAVVTDEGNPTTPFEGRVEFRSDQLGVFSEATCLAAEDIGTLTCNAAFGPRALGQHRLEATFVGDAGHRSSSGGAEITAVAPDGDEDGEGEDGGGDEGGQEGEDGTTLLCAPDAVRTSEASTCTATVTDEEGTVTVPTGRVDFSTNQTGAFGSGAVCDLVADGAGSASCAVDYTPTEVGSGSHRVTAVYDGDGVHQRGVGRDRIAVTAEAPERAATGVSLACTPDRVAATESSTCLATVRDDRQNGPAVPAGTVEFASNRAGLFSDAATCVLAPVGPGSESRCEVTYAPVESGAGDHKVFATYSGSQVHRPSQGVAEIAVEEEAGPPRDATRTVLDCGAEFLEIGQSTPCVATVDALAGDGVPAGDVSFDSNGAGQFSAPTCILQAAAAPATCEVTYTPAAAGTHRVFATYAGSGSHQPSQGDDSVAVTGAPPKQDPPKADPPKQDPPKVDPPKPPVITSTAPNTAIKKMKPKKKKGAKRPASRAVRYLFISDQPGSSFQCAIDKKPFKPCKSPFKLPKPKKVGKHVLQVRAVNPQGVVDPTPAVLKWKVGKARP